MKNNLLKYSALFSGIMLAFSAQAIDKGFSYHGYAKGGMATTSDDILNKSGYDWANNGMNIFRLPGNTYTNSSGGRLGNEANWLEMHIAHGWETTNDMDWGIKANVVYGTDLDLDELYTQGSGLIPSNPSATVWAGKRYFNRVETFLTDSQSMSNDGSGFGIENVDFGFAKFHFGVTRNLYAEAPADGAGELMAFSSSLSDIKLLDDLSMNLYANFGTPSGPDSENKQKNKRDAYQGAVKFRLGDWGSYNELFIRYSNNASGSMTRSWEPLPEYQIGGFWQGYHAFNQAFSVSYIWQHESARYDQQSRDESGMKVIDSDWDTFVVRNTYNWNTRTSTQLELGYEMIDFTAVNSGDDGKNKGHKVTLSQDLHIGGGFWDRPVIHFFVTYAKQDVETKVYDRWGLDGDVKMGKHDAVTYGAQFEAWW
ncbi:carbohydrate porin [Psychromonas sp. MME2]|uniref:carbohydrate porin n=1 Tax=unclassified Psychromonas TaxID=2614957 RepID=UPI00339CFE76